MVQMDKKHFKAYFLKIFKQQFGIRLAILLCFFSFLPAPTANAVADRNFYRGNEVLIYDPDGEPCNDIDTSTGSGATGSSSSETTTGSTNAETAYNFYIGNGLTPVQAAGIVGNFMYESPGVEPTTENNIGGAYGIAQWLGPRKLALKNNTGYDTLQVQLDFSWSELTGSYKTKVLNPLMATSDLTEATNIVLRYYETPCVGAGAEACFATEMGHRLPLSNDILTLYGNGAVSSNTGNAGTTVTGDIPEECEVIYYGTETESTGGSTGGSTTTATGTSGNIITTGQSFAWQHDVKGREGRTNAKQEYRDALAQINAAYKDYTQCIWFVATTMRVSGADPAFPMDNKTSRNYMLNSDKYIVDTTPTLEEIQPGDILQYKAAAGLGYWGHIIIYTGAMTGDDGVTYYAMEASVGTRVPGYRTMSGVDAMLTHGDSISARLK